MQKHIYWQNYIYVISIFFTLSLQLLKLVVLGAPQVTRKFNISLLAKEIHDKEAAFS